MLLMLNHFTRMKEYFFAVKVKKNDQLEVGTTYHNILSFVDNELLISFYATNDIADVGFTRPLKHLWLVGNEKMNSCLEEQWTQYL